MSASTTEVAKWWKMATEWKARAKVAEKKAAICEGTFPGELNGKPAPNLYDATDAACPGWWRGFDYGYARGRKERNALAAELEEVRERGIRTFIGEGSFCAFCSLVTPVIYRKSPEEVLHGDLDCPLSRPPGARGKEIVKELEEARDHLTWADKVMSDSEVRSVLISEKLRKLAERNGVLTEALEEIRRAISERFGFGTVEVKVARFYRRLHKLASVALAESRPEAGEEKK